MDIAKKPKSDVTFKQQIMRLQNKTLAQENKILKLEKKVLHLETENEKLHRNIASPEGLVQVVVAALRKIKHDESPEK